MRWTAGGFFGHGGPWCFIRFAGQPWSGRRHKNRGLRL